MLVEYTKKNNDIYGIQRITGDNHWDINKNKKVAPMVMEALVVVVAVEACSYDGGQI